MPKAKKMEFEIPQTDENVIIVPNNLGECPEERVLVLQDEAVQKTSGGILIPETSQDKPNTGIVIKFGNRGDGKPSTVEVGDRILYGEYSGRELNILGTTYILMSWRDILWNFKH
jgi:chaperonin GroES